MADNYINGKNAVVTAGGATLSFDNWKAKLRAPLPDITNFNSGGFEQNLDGVVGGDITLSGPYNQSNMAFTVGTVYVFSLGYTNAIALSVSARVEEISIDDKLKDACRIEISAKSTGTFTAAIT